MKSIMKVFMFGIVAASVMTPLISLGNGFVLPGVVTVSPDGVEVRGDYSVRYNPNVTQGFIAATLNPGFSVIIGAVDSATGAYFSCYLIRSMNPTQFDGMEKIILSLGNGSRIIATRNGSACTSATLQTGSQSLN